MGLSTRNTVRVEAPCNRKMMSYSAAGALVLVPWDCRVREHATAGPGGHEFRSDPAPACVPAGMPLSLVVERFGWAAYFSTLMAACGVAVLLLAPLAGLRSYTQQQQSLSAGQNGNDDRRDGGNGVRLKAA